MLKIKRVVLFIILFLVLSTKVNALNIESTDSLGQIINDKCPYNTTIKDDLDFSAFKAIFESDIFSFTERKYT